MGENARKVAMVACLFLTALAIVTYAGDKEVAAENAARAWLQQLDSGQYATTWSEASSLFKKHVTQHQWERAAAAARQPLGALVSRQLQSATPATSLPGAPDGAYVVLQFNTVFQHKAAAVETVTPQLEHGVWRVSGYYVK